MNRSTLILIEFDSICVKIVCTVYGVMLIILLIVIIYQLIQVVQQLKHVELMQLEQFDGSLRLEACV